MSSKNSSVHTIDPSQRNDYLPLFKDIPMWNACIHSCLEDGFGTLHGNSARATDCAGIFYGGLVIFAGDAGSPGAQELVRSFPVLPAVLGYSPEWNRLIHRIHGDGVREIRRYHMPCSSFELRQFRELHSHVTRRLDTDYQLESPSSADTEALRESLGWEHPKHHFHDPSDFRLRSFPGIVSLMENSSTAQIVAGASAFIRSGNHAECQVNTVETQRRRGLATVAAAAWLNTALEREIKVPWDAANKASVSLGRKLGYEQVKEYQVLEVFPEQ
ncbi:GNAT family N-acetyltransferase [Salinispira pacifica]|uniref:Acetyltransferase, GNAT family n=1 Tax=Salinispira pacifica TaxID=1307761 RepID=V5WFP0_9SPIO|nr:GNAT family N-acetyltransferase [Salinispira pacifica]AHC14379.1 acetyltransferase, GNAT family [Salinispira pacifica]